MSWMRDDSDAGKGEEAWKHANGGSRWLDLVPGAGRQCHCIAHAALD